MDDHRGAAARAAGAGARAEPERDAATSGEQESLLTSPSHGWPGHGPAAHQVWLPPLDVPDTLDELMPDLADDPALGLVSPRVAGARRR